MMCEEGQAAPDKGPVFEQSRRVQEETRGLGSGGTGLLNEPPLRVGDELHDENRSDEVGPTASRRRSLASHSVYHEAFDISGSDNHLSEDGQNEFEPCDVDQDEGADIGGRESIWRWIIC